MGGTEIYVAGLAEELQKLGIDCVVAVPSSQTEMVTSSYRNIRTIRYPSPPVDSPIQDVLASVPADGFRDVLKIERPDVYHQHDWSPHCGLTNLQAAKALGITVFITIHLPKLICIRHTMMFEGKSQCDGQIIEQRCASCFLQSRRVPHKLAGVLANLPLTLSSKLAHAPAIGRVLSARAQAHRTDVGLRSIGDTVDSFITGSQWLKRCLIENGIAEEKIRIVKLGINAELVSSPADHSERSSPILRVGFLGRWNKAKGLHVLIAALQCVPKSAQFTLLVLALGSNDRADIAYREKVEKVVAGQSQYKLLSNQPRSAVNDFFRSIDVLAVPSQWLETGPLVALEANAWKVPVIGSDLGGIREIVKHRVDGILVPHADVDAWAAALSELAQDPKLVQRLRQNIPPVRTMRDAARDMMGVYQAR